MQQSGQEMMVAWVRKVTVLMGRRGCGIYLGSSHRPRIERGEKGERESRITSRFLVQAIG